MTSISQAPGSIRSALRRQVAWLGVIGVLLVAVDFTILSWASGSAWRTTGLVAAAGIDVLVILVAGNWLVRRPLVRALEALERRTLAAEAQCSQAERLASAGRVAAGLAHEVGNPLCAITNYAHSLVDKVPAELRPTVLSLQREVTRIDRMMDGFIDHTRPRQPQSTTGANVNEALQETLSFLGDQGVLRRIAIDAQLDPSCLSVPGSSLALEQTFANLLLNAADAMPVGGRVAIWTRRVPRVALVNGSPRRVGDERAEPTRRSRNEGLERWVVSRVEPDVIKVVVADSGHGVPRGDEERIFDPFVTTKPVDRGSGLGLSVVRRLVGSMDGLVWAQPSREGGAAFHLVFPAHDDGPESSR